jgi:hypothetical protein
VALSVSDTTIYRTVESGSLNCELAGHHKAAQTPNSEAIKIHATDAEVQKAYDSLNRGLRKRLSWKCLWEVYHHKTLHLL